MTKEEAYAQFDTSLKQTGAGYFDFYLLHNLGESRTEFFDRFDMWNWVQENLSYMKDFTGLSEKERETLKKAQEELKRIPLVPCTTCNYCAKVCLKEIGISGSFTALNCLTLYGDKGMAQHQENWLVGGMEENVRTSVSSAENVRRYVRSTSRSARILRPSVRNF